MDPEKRQAPRRSGDDVIGLLDQAAGQVISRARTILLLTGLVSTAMIYVVVQIISPALAAKRLEAEQVHEMALIDTVARNNRHSIDSLGSIEDAKRDQELDRLTGVEQTVAALLALSCNNLSARDLRLARAQCDRAHARAGIPSSR